MKETPVCVYCGRGECNRQLDSDHYHEACFRSAIQKGIDCACPKCEGKRKAEVKQTPLLFSGPMVRSILAGTKTMTRRVVNPQPKNPVGPNFDGLWSDTKDPVTRYFASPYGKPGDRLWVRETFSISGNGYFYRADVKQPETVNYSWKPSIFMPRTASRITLEVTGVRVERLQEIGKDGRTAKHVLSEGVTQSQIDHWKKWLHPDDAPAHAFGCLWDSINRKRKGGIYAWDKSPWVWVISFKKL